MDHEIKLEPDNQNLDDLINELKDPKERSSSEVCREIVQLSKTSRDFKPSVQQLIELMPLLFTRVLVKDSLIKLPAASAVKALLPNLDIIDDKELDSLMPSLVSLLGENSEESLAFLSGYDVIKVLAERPGNFTAWQAEQLVPLLIQALEAKRGGVYLLAHEAIVAISPKIKKSQIFSLFSKNIAKNSQIIKLIPSLIVLLENNDRAFCETVANVVKVLTLKLTRLTGSQAVGLIRCLIKPLTGERSVVSNTIKESVEMLVQKIDSLTSKQAADLMPIFIDLIEDTPYYIREVACEVSKVLISKSEAFTDEDADCFIPKLVLLLESESEFVCQVACDVIRVLAEKITDEKANILVSSLASFLKTGNGLVAQAACQAVKILIPRLTSLTDEQVSDITSPLIDLLKNNDWLVRQAACQTIGLLVPKFETLSDQQAVELISHLSRALIDESESVRQAACQTLGLLAPKFKTLSDQQAVELISPLIDLLKNNDWLVRQAACQTIGLLVPKFKTLSDQQAVELISPLSRALIDESESVRQAACQTIGLLVPKFKTLSDQQAVELISHLSRALIDESESVRQAACQTIGLLAPKFKTLSDQQAVESMSHLSNKLEEQVESNDVERKKLIRSSIGVVFSNFSESQQSALIASLEKEIKASSKATRSFWTITGLSLLAGGVSFGLAYKGTSLITLLGIKGLGSSVLFLAGVNAALGFVATFLFLGLLYLGYSAISGPSATERAARNLKTLSIIIVLAPSLSEDQKGILRPHLEKLQANANEAVKGLAESSLTDLNKKEIVIHKTKNTVNSDDMSVSYKSDNNSFKVGSQQSVGSDTTLHDSTQTISNQL